MKFIEDLKKELSKTNLNKSEIEEIINDFSEMVEEAMESGLLETDLVSKFGSPEKLANELASEHAPSENTESNNSSNTFEFLPQEGYKIVIELLNEDIEIETENSNKIKIEARKVRRLKDYEIKFENNTLYIKKPRKQFMEFFSFSKSSQFILKLPKQYKVKDFNFSNINGDGVIKNIDVENIKFKVTNGDFDLENNKFGKIEVDTINGSIKMKSITSNQFRASLVSGDMILKEMDIAEDFNVNTVSGDIEVENVNCKQAFVRLVSGDFEAKEFYPNEITVRTVSGDVDVKNKDREKRIEIIKKSSVSGDININ
jgi:DUF4097 and DUF4098 domain-containing protein YvlB